MQFELPLGSFRLKAADDYRLAVGDRSIRLLLVSNRRARRYVLRLQPDGAARVTIPRAGSMAEGRRFAERNIAWLEKQLLKQAQQPRHPPGWELGSRILFRGEPVLLERGGAADEPFVRFGSECLRVRDPGADLRPEVEKHLRALAARELPARVSELAGLHQFKVGRVKIRNQRSRWGSCSPRATISLNWRLVQAPVLVRDYIILHELAHLKEMNHSRRFWREVERLCPEFATAEAWLKSQRHLLR